MKAEEFKGKSADELKKILLEKRKEQFNLRFQLSGGQLENTAQMRKIRREIAQVKTFITQSKAA
jgi:large subunit ribosomal protein L29